MSGVTTSLTANLQTAQQGAGPLLQRDYWARIKDARLGPAEIMDDVARRFCAYAPPELVVFDRGREAEQPLEVGEELEVRIRVAGRCRVRVVCRDRQSLTLATMAGHPEAGRITFGAYRDDEGIVIFHIRSRARASSELRYLGWLVAGEPMQTNTWTDFVKAVAVTFGEGVVGYVHAETTQIEDEGQGEDDDPVLCSPTFLARGD